MHGGPRFRRTPLFAGTAWSFGDSWATSVTPLTALAGGLLAASGAVAGREAGVDLTRFGLLMALVGGLTVPRPPGGAAPAGVVAGRSRPPGGPRSRAASRDRSVIRPRSSLLPATLIEITARSAKCSAGARQ